MAFNYIYEVCSLMNRGEMCQGQRIRSSLAMLV
jgi:hypothetical protein